MRLRRYLLDLVIVAACAVVPGIRGYGNWRGYELAVLVCACGYLLYRNHKSARWQRAAR